MSEKLQVPHGHILFPIYFFFRLLDEFQKRKNHVETWVARLGLKNYWRGRAESEETY